MYAIERIVSRHNHFIGVIYQDECPENPLTEWDMFMSGMVYDRRSRYICGDTPVNREDFRLPKGAIALPVYSNDSTGECDASAKPVTSWPDGADALVYVTREKVLQEYKCKIISKERRASVVSLLQGEVEVYSRYRSGDVYYFVVYTVPPDVNLDEDLEKLQDWQVQGWEVYDSCGGFYGLKEAADALRDNMELFDKAKQSELDRAMDAELVDCM